MTSGSVPTPAPPSVSGNVPPPALPRFKSGSGGGEREASVMDCVLYAQGLENDGKGISTG